MKKMTLIIANICIATLAFGQSTTLKSLNGIDQQSALAMIAHFAAHKDSDKSPHTVSVWLSKEMIHGMVMLLDSELNTQTPVRREGLDTADKTIGLTDGVRIYYASDPSKNTYPLATSIIMVSTKDDGISQEPMGICPSGKRHIDYFEHASNAALFTVNNLNGIICNDNSGCGGASLYNTCYDCAPDEVCPQAVTHAITRDNAEAMVHNFKLHAINTTSEWFDLALWRAIDADTIHTGVRIYFATNPYDRINTYRSLRDLLVITTTKTDPITGANIDYFDCGIPAYYKALYIKRRPAAGNWADPAQDNGELCPRNCN